MNEIKIWSEKVKENIGQVFFGKEEVINKILAGLLCGGNILLEDVPGLGKTVLAKALSISLGGEFNRIQATPDLLPNDILGLSIYSQKEEEFKFCPGPIFGNFVLVDEINRATPRTQSAFLEAMAENKVSIDGEIKDLPDPFFLIATENPTEFEGTFPLPEAQKDRFFMTINIGYPSREAERDILESHRRTTHPISELGSVSNLEELKKLKKMVTQVNVDESVREFILDLVESTRKSSYLELGASPRGSLALYKGAQAYAAIFGRDYVTPEDVIEVFIPIMCQRVVLKPEHLIKGLNVESLLNNLVGEVVTPPMVKV